MATTCLAGNAPQEPRQLDLSFAVDELPDAPVVQGEADASPVG